MPTPVLPFAPVRDGYGFEPGYGVVSTRLDGGASRMRLDVIGSAHSVRMQWILKGQEYTILMGFFRDTLTEGTLPFLAELLTDIRTLTVHKCRCMGGKMPELTGNKGDAYYLQMTAEVENNPTHTGTFTFSTSFTSVDTGVAMPEYINGDKFRIVDSYKVGFSGNNFDGTYVVTSTGATSVVASAAGSVNPEWGFGGIYVIPATITRVPI